MSKSNTCIIIDDEEIARLRLRKMLSDFPEIKILDEAENGLLAVEKITELKPDLIFLDIQMPGLNGFEVLSKLKEDLPVIIFTTAFDEFALKAFDENAIAYLLKPIEAEKLKRAIEKSKRLLKQSTPDMEIYSKLLSLVEKKDFKQFVSKIGSRYKFIPKEDVSHISSKDKHTFIHLKEGAEYIIDQTLLELEGILDDSFIRVHRNSFISKNCISNAEKAGDGKFLFTMNDTKKSQVQSAASYSSAIRQALGL